MLKTLYTATHTHIYFELLFFPLYSSDPHPLE